jgi:hypothetical protein
MQIEIQALDEVPEGSIKKMVRDFAQDGAKIVTAINDGKGTFSVEATFIDEAPQGSLTQNGKISTFGGPHDMGVSSSAGLALFEPADIATAPAGLFLDSQPPETTGLARRLNPAFNYLACRWDYLITPRAFLRESSVVVSANGTSVTARPVDWGPNIATGRVADLSPGLAHALGLKTDDNCTLLIPIPDGATIPIPDAAPALSIDLRAIDATTLPANLTRTLVVMTAYDNSVYWLVNLVGPNEGGQTLMRQVGNGEPKLIRSDTVLLPAKVDADVSEVVAGELNKAIRKEPDTIAGPAGPAPHAGDDINAKMFTTARAFVGHVTSNVMGTDHGNLACAWAVNEVARLALGRPISSESGGKNGLSTADLFDALRIHHTELGSANDARPGTIIIAPTRGANHGHVGIVGTTTTSIGNTQVFSNKSVPGVFALNFTISSFVSHYTGNGLDVFFFALKPDQFAAVLAA